MTKGMNTVWGASSVSRVDITADSRYQWFIANLADFVAHGDLMRLENPGPAKADKVASIGMFEIYRCPETGFQFANPRLSTLGTIRNFSANDYADYFATVEQTKETRRQIAYQPVLEYLRQHCPGPASLLEIGCGSGAFLEFLRDDGGYDVEGVEIAPAAIPYQQAKGLKVHQHPIETLNPGRTFDIVLMWSVLDHLADPLEAMRACYRAVKPGGILAVGNVNIDGFDHQMMGYDNFTFRPPGRVNYYNVKALCAHLRLAGFEITDVTTPGKLDVDMVRDYWNANPDRPRAPFLGSLLMEPGNDVAARAFQDFLVSQSLSGYQRVLARRPK